MYRDRRLGECEFWANGVAQRFQKAVNSVTIETSNLERGFALALKLSDRGFRPVFGVQG